MEKKTQIFLSYASEDAFEASLLQWCIEAMLKDKNVVVWTYERNQRRSQSSVARSLSDRIKESVAAIVLISQYTFRSGKTQWMELAYADAFEVPIFILLHHLDFEQLLRSGKGVPPLVLERPCTPAVQWRSLDNDIRRCCSFA